MRFQTPARRIIAVLAAALPALMIGLPAHASEGTNLSQASALVPSQFAGEALTVAVAFALPAIVAGAYLALERLNARFGGRTLMIAGVTLGAVGLLVAVVEDKAALLQRAGLAAL
jgi:hypothetical protein